MRVTREVAQPVVRFPKTVLFTLASDKSGVELVAFVLFVVRSPLAIVLPNLIAIQDMFLKMSKTYFLERHTHMQIRLNHSIDPWGGSWRYPRGEQLKLRVYIPKATAPYTNYSGLGIRYTSHHRNRSLLTFILRRNQPALRAVLVTAKQHCALVNTEEYTPTNNAAALYQPERMHPATNHGDSKRWWIFVYFGAEQSAKPFRDFQEIGGGWIQQTAVERHRFQNHVERYHDASWKNIWNRHNKGWGRHITQSHKTFDNSYETTLQHLFLLVSYLS